MVTKPGQGNFYRVSPPPQSGGLAALRQWCEREYGRIEKAVQEGAMESIRMDQVKALPFRAHDGMMMNFVAGVAGPEAGFYEYQGGSWIKL